VNMDDHETNDRERIRLTQLSSRPVEPLNGVRVTCKMSLPRSLRLCRGLMLGFETSDDAAVYRLSEDMAALLTVDFFTPIVTTPTNFGRIAAANSLSESMRWAGRPLTALNLLAFPCSLDPRSRRSRAWRRRRRSWRPAPSRWGGHTIDERRAEFGLS